MTQCRKEQVLFLQSTILTDIRLTHKPLTSGPDDPVPSSGPHEYRTQRCMYPIPPTQIHKITLN